MAVPRGKGLIPELRLRPSFKNTATGSNVQDVGAQNKSYHNSGFSKPPYTGDKVRDAGPVAVHIINQLIIGRLMKSHVPRQSHGL